MANEELIALLRSLQGSGGSPGSNLLAQLPALVGAASDTAPATGASRVASAASTAARTLGGGLTLLPVVGTLLKLFGVGRGNPEPPPLEKFALPPAIRAEAGLSRTGETYLIDRGAGDRIRPVNPPAGSGPDRAYGPARLGTAYDATAVRPAGFETSGGGLAGDRIGVPPLDTRLEGRSSNPAGTTPSGAGPTITVNVQAMDSQSFLDRREDIARAVREAMLQSHSLNDIVSEL